MRFALKREVTFEEMFELLDAKIAYFEASLALWSWRVQKAAPHHLVCVEEGVCRALDRLWKAQEACRA